MEPNSHRDPDKALRALMAADIQLIYACDPRLAADLDVSPPQVNTADDLTNFATLGASGGRKGLAYRAARRIYRKLKEWKLLQPIAERVRDEVRRHS